MAEDDVFRPPAGGPGPPVGMNDRLRPLDLAYTVQITSSEHGEVWAPLPHPWTFSTYSEWDYVLQSSQGGLISVLLQEGAGLSRATQFQTAQFWAGNLPPELTLNLEFRAQSNPYTEVQLPIMRLQQMQLPRGGMALLTPPGPRIFNHLQASDEIIINVGRFMLLRKVIVISVDVEWEGIMTRSGIPQAALVTVTFRAPLALMAEDIPNIYGRYASGQSFPEVSFGEAFDAIRRAEQAVDDRIGGLIGGAADAVVGP